jgi:succinoglycan biosynthesis transport protein ExoP
MQPRTLPMGTPSRSLSHPFDVMPMHEPSMSEPPEQMLSFGHYLWLLRRRWLRITIFVVCCTAAAAFISSRLTPEYESTARIAIDPQTPSTVVGDSTSNATISDTDQLFNTEVQLVQSDAVLRPVAQQFHLTTRPASKHIPAGMDPSEAPVALANLSVTHPPNSYLINITYRSQNPVEGAAIANAIASSYIHQGLEMRARSALESSVFMETQIAQLKQNMDKSENALAEYEERLGVINPEEKTSILEARLLQLNTQYTDAQNERIRTEVASQALRSGSAAAVEVSPQAANLAKLEEALRGAQQKMVEIKSIYGPNYAEYKRAADELAEVTRQYEAAKTDIGKRIDVEHDEASNRADLLQAALQQAKNESDALHAQSIQFEEIKSDAETNKSLYNELFRKVKEASINGSFQGGAIRIADLARPQIQPVFPNKKVFTALGFLFALATSVIFVLGQDVVDKTLRDPEQARRVLGVPLIGILPRVRKFPSLSPTGSLALTTGAKSNKPVKNWFMSADFYEEAVYTLLSSVMVAGRGYAMRTILITSAATGEGKSTCAAQMAAAHARQGYRTLLIDADLRRPAQQSNFGLTNGTGLANGITESQGMRAIRQSVPGYENFDIITAGSADRRVLGWVGRKVEQILKEARLEYDVVFIDAPPMLCFAEPLQLARIADGVLVVCHAGQTSRQAVGSVLDTLRHLGANTLGIILNQVQNDMSSAYHPYQSYYQSIEHTA